MDGDIAPIGDICDLAERYQADGECAEAAGHEHGDDAPPGGGGEDEKNQQDCESEPLQAGALARRARIGPETVRTRRLEPAHGRRDQGTAPHGGRDQRAGGRAHVMGGDGCQRRDLCDDHDREGDGAVGAEPAVAHDLELAVAVAASAETVGDVGQPVLVECAGEPDDDPDGQRCRDGGRHPAPGESAEHERPRAADAEADQGEEPHRGGETWRCHAGFVVDARVPRDGQARQERHRQAKLRSGRARARLVVCIHARLIGQPFPFRNGTCGHTI